MRASPKQLTLLENLGRDRQWPDFSTLENYQDLLAREDLTAGAASALISAALRLPRRPKVWSRPN